MNIKNFAETYFKLEEKSLEIMKVYELEHYAFDGMELEEWKGKTNFIIRTYDRDNDQVWLEFDLEEMNNDIDYFKAKHEENVERARIAKEFVEKNQNLKYENKN